MLKLRIAVAAALIAAGAGAGFAADDVQRQQCRTQRDQGVTPQQKIAACDALIKSGGFAGADLGNIYAWRGDGYNFANHFDTAIADYDTSLEVYAKAGETPPADIYVMRGFAYQGAGRLARAIADFNTAIANNPRLPYGFHGRAVSYAMAGFSATGRADLDTVIALQPNLIDGYVARAAAWLDVGDVPRAIQDIDYALLLAPDYAGAYLNRGIAYRTMGQFELAAGDFKKSLELLHGDALPSGRITRADIEKQRDLAATDLAQWQAARDAPVPPAPAHAPGQVAPSRAVGRTHDCAVMYPNISRQLAEQGDVLVSYDVDDKGMVRNVTLLRTSGSERLDRAALACVATLWRNTPASRDGVGLASPGHQAIVRFTVPQPDTADGFSSQAQGYAGIGDLARAIAIFDRALALAPKSAEILYHRGWTAYMMGDSGRAIADFNLALQIKPHDRDTEDARDLARARGQSPAPGHAI